MIQSPFFKSISLVVHLPLPLPPSPQLKRALDEPILLALLLLC